MNPNLFVPLIRFLVTEKKIAEQQILELKEVRFKQISRVNKWQVKFNVCHKKSIWCLPILIYTIVRLESAKSNFSNTEHDLIYYKVAHQLISKGLESLPNDYWPALTALEHIEKFRPLSIAALNPEFLHDGELSKPRYTARFFYEEIKGTPIN